MRGEKNSNRNLVSFRGDSIVYHRHLILKKEYQNNPALARITDSARVIGVNLKDPFRTLVSINDKMKVPFKIGVHKAVGGDHDFPNPGDLLCASLASCFESTLRLISNKLGIELLETKILATAQIDVRGALMIDRSIPVEFQSMHIDAFIKANNLNERILNSLINGVKASCIIYQTLKRGIPITMKIDFIINNKNHKS